jgi:dolichol-phosphate mannosyltransferase
MAEENKIAVIIPCYKVTKHILAVLQKIGPEVDFIYVVDDCCPDNTAEWVRTHCSDPRIRRIRHEQNLGVGGAVITGYRAAILEGATLLIKLDGDGQMDPALIPQLIAPLLRGDADYTKGNRFFNLEKIRAMPTLRLFGNALLSFIAKLSTGYWDIFDPTNGYTALHADVAKQLPFDKISPRYFFESDLLFRLNTLRAVVVDVPMDAHYGDEISHLTISHIIGEFLFKHARNFFKRLFYNYYLRNMSLASIELPLGTLFLFFGLIYGSIQWMHSAKHHLPTPTGTIMIATLSTIIGLQFVMAFLNYDMNSVCRNPLHRRLNKVTPRENRA